MRPSSGRDSRTGPSRSSFKSLQPFPTPVVLHPTPLTCCFPSLWHPHPRQGLTGGTSVMTWIEAHLDFEAFKSGVKPFFRLIC